MDFDLLIANYVPRYNGKKRKGRSEWAKKCRYIKREHHKKKILTDKEKIKKDWREFKGMIKDKAKKHQRFNRGPSKHYKRLSQKFHRTWQKKHLCQENWETLLDYKKIKYFCDPWIWD